jgi:serine/threonine protein kinase|tara:strand:+ start:1222 stop:1464 length:243 start_codon:yes stop_codon:yes gene_type:complete
MNMSDQITNNTVELVQKLDDMPILKFDMILPYKDYIPIDIQQASDLISKMLKWVPRERIDCKEALKHPFFKSVKESIEDK